ncbi:nucleotide-binding protein [Aeromonas veronii]|uniref:nucleotide-binding protein n=1 Tax=Aeromonas veronii TaxID=654 RepID=UPI00217D8AC9|nr:nucleotide-binding protein [Aeromonas veronii]UWH26262.1 nucleotide-binding protein [Aeromonas veronii]
MKPRVFIGSSVEGLNVAYAIQQNLTHDVEPTVWDQDIFDLSKTTIESLMKAVDDSDFGIFVFSPDDIIKMRGGELNSIRDNVIFEFGLFTGRLGRERVFFVKPDGLGKVRISGEILLG